MTRFIAYEYITAQAASRRAQNVFGALACLAGGAQLHSRANLEAIGGRIDTTSLAEDTFTTFNTQLAGRRVVFDGNATVLAEEPGNILGLWKQRLRWARGNVQVTLRFKHVWFRPSRNAPSRQRRVRGQLVLPFPSSDIHDSLVGRARHPLLREFPGVVAPVPPPLDHQRGQFHISSRRWLC